MVSWAMPARGRSKKMSESSDPDSPVDTAHATRLPVLPHSGKVDALREESRHAVHNIIPVPPISHSEAFKPMHASGDFAPGQRAIEMMIIEKLRTIYDPEIPVNIYDLGLIYRIDITPENAVKVQMTLTAPGCPVADSLVNDVHKKVESIDQVTDTEVELVWDPPWDKSRMSEAALLDLGML
jgi:FeS assembly SUF system protein